MINLPPNLTAIVNALKVKAHALMDDILADATMDPLANIVGNQVKVLGMKELEATIKKSQAVVEMKEFGLKIVDVENYKALFEIMLNKSPANEDLIKKIQTENNNLDLEEITKTVKSMANNLATELKLAEKETETIISIFDKLIAKHLPGFNALRLSVVEQLSNHKKRPRPEKSELAESSKTNERPLKRRKME